MKTPKLRLLSLAGLAASALICSTPLLARDFNDYPRHISYERDYRGDHDRRHGIERHHVVMERPVYLHRRPIIVERPVHVHQERVIYRDAPAPIYANPAPQVSLGAIIGAALGTIVENRITSNN